MRNLSSIIVLLFISVGLLSQSPHGDQLSINCEDCHNPEGWKMVKGTYSFNHDSTSFPLEGQHRSIDCRMCHQTLVFSQAKPECMSCHTDMHYQTVGFACERCHTPTSWIVNNISEVHRLSRFPLVGPHATADCQQCHPSASLLRFEPLGVECFDCHQADYMAATSPNHVEGDYSTNCIECHNMNVFSWAGANFNHAFFPLTAGHAINDCKQCHTGTDYSDISSDCFSCHEPDYNTTTNPNHNAADIAVNCSECHTTQPGWKPAEFRQHDAQYFPVYSGEHQGEWASCTECHTNPSNYMVFTCIDCHEHNPEDTNDEHEGIGGYVYSSPACLECHPNGEGEGGFDHNQSNFPLTGAHTIVDCASCHATGYEGTTTVCYECHTADFNQTTNPNHIETGIATECESCHSTATGWVPASFDNHNDFYFLSGAHATIANDCFQCHQGNYSSTPNTCVGCHNEEFNQTSNPNHNAIGLSNICDICHTTNPEWKPAQFPVHNEYYVLAGAHAVVAGDCNVCHEGNYNNTPNTCVGCHQEDYNQTTDPNHNEAGFSTDCQTCHTETAWEPSTFDHDGQYFPIYSGEHQGEWASCVECHTNPGNYAIFSCIDCHEHNQQDTDEEHQGVGGYAYNSEACYACHPTGEGSGGFNHDLTEFPLTGAHITVNCLDCHEDGYTGTTTFCFDCHTDPYNQSANPDHLALNIPNVCADCHSTQPGWERATFAIHNDYYALNGAHAAISNNCVTCHEGDYNNTPNTCVGCHLDDYNQTTDPDHGEAGFSTDCQTCHTETAWEPSTFDHDGQYFPIYSGEHQGEWASCVECHTNPGNYAIFSCIDCHEHNQADMDEEHEGIGGYIYNSEACYACHPTGEGTGGFNHDQTNFPLTGAHITVNCLDCHEDGYTGTTTFCFDCHTEPYNQSTNPNHLALNIPNVCADCHTTVPDWAPALFPIHNDYYELTGAHASISNNCASCHNGDYNNTPYTCFECHNADYNGTTNPNHLALNIPTVCDECHTPLPDWMPALFPIHNNYYELTGAHASISNNCVSCHNGDYNNTPNTCFECHNADYNGTTNPNHQVLNLSTVCDQCHTTLPGWEPALFPVHNDYYVLNGAHANIANDCILCHNGDYNNTPTTCFGCHESDYNQTTDPAHLPAQFPTECELCHTEVSWIPSTFNHDGQYFPIYSGEHQGEWNSCTDCHINPNNYAIFSCIDCHEHNQADMDDEHDGVSGYIYESIACLNCHPNGEEDHLNIQKKFN